MVTQRGVSLQIKQIVKEDIKEIASLCKDSFDPIFGETPLEQSIGFIEHMFRKRIQAASLKAVEGGAIVGYVFATPSPFEEYWEPEAAFMHSIAVKKEFRRKRIASALTERCLRMLKEAGYKKVWLDVLLSNKEAIALYGKYGFEKTRYMMEKKL